MPLSISSSEMNKRRIVVLISLLAGVLVGAEVCTRRLIARHSKVEIMVEREHREALQIRPEPNGPKSLLIVGSSYVGMDLDFPLLKQQLAPAWSVHRYWIYNTFYNDWYYGLKRLLEEGCHPDAIAITFAAPSFYVPDIRGDYSSYYLFQPRDLPGLQADAKLSNTETANLLFARYSRFYGLRSEIRKVLLQTVVHDLPRMYQLFNPASGSSLKGSVVLSIVAPRLAKLQRLVASHGVQLLLIVPPLPRADREFQGEMRTAAQAAGIPIVMPFSCRDVPRNLFIDDVHLSPEGASKFTAAVAPKLFEVLRATETPRKIDALNLGRAHIAGAVTRRPISAAMQGARSVLDNGFICFQF
jgi:hypothetical protein